MSHNTPSPTLIFPKVTSKLQSSEIPTQNTGLPTKEQDAGFSTPNPNEVIIPSPIMISSSQNIGEHDSRYSSGSNTTEVQISKATKSPNPFSAADSFPPSTNTEVHPQDRSNAPDHIVSSSDLNSKPRLPVVSTTRLLPSPTFDGVLQDICRYLKDVTENQQQLISAFENHMRELKEILQNRNKPGEEHKVSSGGQVTNRDDRDVEVQEISKYACKKLWKNHSLRLQMLEEMTRVIDAGEVAESATGKLFFKVLNVLRHNGILTGIRLRFLIEYWSVIGLPNAGGEIQRLAEAWNIVLLNHATLPVGELWSRLHGKGAQIDLHLYDPTSNDEVPHDKTDLINFFEHFMNSMTEGLQNLNMTMLYAELICLLYDAKQPQPRSTGSAIQFQLSRPVKNPYTEHVPRECDLLISQRFDESVRKSAGKTLTCRQTSEADNEESKAWQVIREKAVTIACMALMKRDAEKRGLGDLTERSQLDPKPLLPTSYPNPTSYLQTDLERLGMVMTTLKNVVPAPSRRQKNNRLRSPSPRVDEEEEGDFVYDYADDEEEKEDEGETVTTVRAKKKNIRKKSPNPRSESHKTDMDNPKLLIVGPLVKKKVKHSEFQVTKKTAVMEEEEGFGEDGEDGEDEEDEEGREEEKEEKKKKKNKIKTQSPRKLKQQPILEITSNKASNKKGSSKPLRTDSKTTKPPEK